MKGEKKNVSPFGKERPYKKNREDSSSGEEYLDEGAGRVSGPEASLENDLSEINDGLREKVTSVLQNSSRIDPSDIKVDVENGDVILHGKAQRKRDRALAQKIAESIEGVNKVDNQLEVNTDTAGKEP